MLVHGSNFILRATVTVLKQEGDNEKNFILRKFNREKYLGRLGKEENGSKP
jgi:hypothetical protein